MREFLPIRLVGITWYKCLCQYNLPYLSLYIECKTTTINTTNGYTRYADNYTRTCVYPFQCSFGYYADNFTHSCRPGCPNAPSPAYVNTSSVGYINMVCQVTCQPPYFADYAAGMCVTTCQTNNTYADVSSGRTCVIACNSSGLTPWANSYTRTCVSSTFLSI